jgi:threonine dehydratase
MTPRGPRAGKIIPMVDPHTIADGLRSSVGTLTFPLIQALVDDIVTVSEPGIVDAMKSLWEIMKIVIEPSGAVSFGIVNELAVPVAGLRVGIILTGGNLDLGQLPWAKA